MCYLIGLIFVVGSSCRLIGRIIVGGLYSIHRGEGASSYPPVQEVLGDHHYTVPAVFSHLSTNPVRHINLYCYGF